MGILNSWNYTRSIFLWDVFAQATGNQYRVVSVRPYKDKKGILPNGYSLTLMIIKDDYDYGVDSKTGEPRDSNLYVNFDVVVLNDKLKIKKSDIISLLDYDDKNSMVIGFDMILRFKDAKVISSSDTKGTKPNA